MTLLLLLFYNCESLHVLWDNPNPCPQAAVTQSDSRMKSLSSLRVRAICHVHRDHVVRTERPGGGKASFSSALSGRKRQKQKGGGGVREKASDAENEACPAKGFLWGLN